MGSRPIRLGAEILTLPVGGMDAEVDVLDILEHHVHRNVAEFELQTSQSLASSISVPSSSGIGLKRALHLMNLAFAGKFQSPPHRGSV